MLAWAAWARVRDYRVNQLSKLPNVEHYLESEVDEAQIREFGADHVVLATGAAWRRDGLGRWHDDPIDGWESSLVVTPDDIMGGLVPDGPVLVYDDDHYYMGGVLAETLRKQGLDVTLATPANEASSWTTHTEEQHRIQERILTLGIDLITGTELASISEDGATLQSIYTGEQRQLGFDKIVMVTSRQPRDALFHSMENEISITRIGDCYAPGTIATSVYSGHRFARELDADNSVPVAFLRERPTGVR